MPVDPSFSERVSAFGKKVAHLHNGGRTLNESQHNLEELSVALEELRTADEELRTQHDELLLIQAQLESERARYRDLFENAPDAYLVTDPRGLVVEANRAAGRLLGIPNRYLPGKPLLHYFQSTDVRNVRHCIRELRHTHAPGQVHGRLNPRNGPPIHVTVTLTAITQPGDIDEHCAGIRWLIRDASALKNAELQVIDLREQLTQFEQERETLLPMDVREAMNLAVRERAAREQAEHSSRMKDQFLALVVHELRNPLTPVLTVLEELLEKKEKSHPASREVLEMMHRNLLSQSRMIGDLLDVARIIHGKLQMRREVIDARTPLREALDGLKEAAAAKRHQIKAELPDEVAAVYGDAVRLRQVFWNLINNAVKFTPAGGRIRVQLAVEGDAVIVEVRDTGMGINHEALATIFDAFEQTSSQYARSLGGLGLGLSIVRSLTEAHGGKVTVCSDGEGAGATFRVELPRSTETPKLNAPEPAQQFQQARSMRILLVEDHTDTRKALASLLSKMGHDVSSASTVEEALNQAERKEFDVMISDLSLPDGNGRDILARAPREHLKTAIAYSGWGMPEDIERSRTAGFEFHLTKPVSIDQLRQILLKLSNGAGAAG